MLCLSSITASNQRELGFEHRPLTLRQVPCTTLPLSAVQETSVGRSCWILRELEGTLCGDSSATSLRQLSSLQRQPLASLGRSTPSLCRAGQRSHCRLASISLDERCCFWSPRGLQVVAWVSSSRVTESDVQCQRHSMRMVLM